MKSVVGTYCHSGDSSEAGRKLKEVWNSAALNKSTTSKEISFQPAVRSSVLVEALAKSDCFSTTTSGGVFTKLLRSRLDTYGINAVVTQERFVRETLKAMDEHNRNTSDDKENTTGGEKESMKSRIARLEKQQSVADRFRRPLDLQAKRVKAELKETAQDNKKLKAKLKYMEGSRALAKVMGGGHSCLAQKNKSPSNLGSEKTTGGKRMSLPAFNSKPSQVKLNIHQHLCNEMKVVEAENCVLKSRLAAMEKQMEERETQSKENVKMMEEINEKMVAKLKEELATADTRAQVAEWDNQELRLEVEELKEKIKSMDVHIEALAYSGDTAWELSNSLEARVEQLEEENSQLVRNKQEGVPRQAGVDCNDLGGSSPPQPGNEPSCTDETCRLEKEALALEVELLKQLRDLGLKDGNNNNEEFRLLHSTRLGDQELQTPDHFESEKLGTAMGGLDLGGSGEAESLLLTPGDLEASVELPFQTALPCHDCIDHLSDQDVCKGLESGDADENGDSEKELTLAPPLQTPMSRSEKYASIKRSNLTRVNVTTTPPTTPVDNNMPVHNFDGTAAEIESDDSDRGPSRTGCGSSVRQALAKRLTNQKKSSPSVKLATNDSGLEGKVDQETKSHKSPN